MRNSSVLAISLMALPATACVESTVFTVFNAAHHGSRVEGMLPDLGDPEKPRIFVNDLGWTITLSEGFVVTTAAQLESCEGETVEIETPFGPYPEYWSEQDKNVTDFGTAEVPEDKYCTLILEYGRYRSDVALMAEDTPFSIKNLDQVEGRTIYLAGYAERPDGMGGAIVHNFGLETDMTVQVRLDLAKIKDGLPFEITGGENATPNLTVLKAYDALFKGVDFDKLDVAAFNQSIPQRLADNTTVILGTSVY
jgi:hypothetical protein